VPPPRRPAIYLSHNGADTPLVQSQVIPYLDGLVARGFEIELVTFERGTWPAWRPSTALGWRPLRSRPGTSILDKVIDITSGTTTVLRATVALDTPLIHARSYVAATIAMLVGAFTRKPYLFDMRGFLPEEFLDAGYWSAGDIRYRALRLVEPMLLRNAREIVVLTHRAAERLRDDPTYRAARHSRVTVIPCAVDLAKFRPGPSGSAKWTLVYSGTLGSFYEIRAMLQVFRYMLDARADATMLLLNQREHELIQRTAAELGVPWERLTVKGVRPDEVPAQLAAASVGIALVKQAPSKMGSSAIKVAEYLACGLPVLVNSGLGDVAASVRELDAGYVLSDYSDTELRAAAKRALDLAGSAPARANARRLAERDYDLEAATDAYAEIYRRLMRAR
jgi:glycosyltransferase involved in cell wall biosynthesis